MVTVRFLTPDDAEQFLDLCLTLDSESDFMMYEPGERPTDVEMLHETLAAIVRTDNQAIVVADTGQLLAGYAGFYGGEYRRARHVAYIVAGVRSAFAGQGIGRALFEAGEAWARSAGVRRLELTVMTHNAAAIRLYQRMGFDVEGTRRRAMLVNGQWIDELYMGKLLD
jgi:RimJ/RimL family protein N-acetyltransferase